MHKFAFWYVGLGLLFNIQQMAAQTATANGVAFFENKIRPVLVQRCYECHSVESGKTKGGLLVDSKDALRRGGDSGPAIVPPSLDKSLLYQAITYQHDDLEMPPKGKLPDSVIADFRTWIQLGAPDPRSAKIQPVHKSKIDLSKGRQHWAYQPLVRKAPPETAGSLWPRSEIDQFIFSKLTEQKLKPVNDASAPSLVRRLYFVLTGLPPNPEQAAGWVNQIQSQTTEGARQKVIAKLVDHLLATPQYGERWGRHWLDVARFAESTGGDQNNIFQHAWRYRDYVIDSFNADKPFNQFIKEQIAGDLLPIANDQEWANNVIATGFLAIGQKLVGEENQQKYFADLVDEQIDATTRAFLATSVACARCHDHKSDPIPQSDYYAMAGIFRSTQTHYGLLKAQARQATTLLDLTGLGLPSAVPPLNPNELSALKKARDDARKTVEDAMAKIRAGENVFRGTLRRIRSQRDEKEAALQSYLENGQPRVFAMGTQDRDLPLPTRLLIRGELDKPAQEIPRGVLQVISPPGRSALPSNTQGSGRIQLANWIAWTRNPLTPRVMANRVWHWMFGRGLVRTVDDFGATGELPANQELLDYLAIRLVDNQWSVKQLIREIALSRTWQLSSTYNEQSFSIDPDNQYTWRMSPRRLEAEAIRDAMLALSGQLNLQRPLGTLLSQVGEGNVGQNVFEPDIRAIDSKHRSIYLPRVRGVLPEVLELFDAPDASTVTGSRNRTSTSLQSLYLMNHPFVQEQAAAFAKRVNAQTPQQRLRYAYQLAYGRSPTSNEVQHAQTFIQQLGQSRMTAEEKMAAYCQALLCTTEFQTID